MADGGPKTYPDPAFDAHLLPIGQATAVWGDWPPRTSLQKIVSTAAANIEKAKNAWAVCYGPWAAPVADCRRLEWKIMDATTVMTDDGRMLQLALDSPAAVAIQAKLAVKRQRWRNHENASGAC